MGRLRWVMLRGREGDVKRSEFRPSYISRSGTFSSVEESIDTKVRFSHLSPGWSNSLKKGLESLKRIVRLPVYILPSCRLQNCTDTVYLTIKEP